MVNVTLGDKTYTGVAAVKTDTPEGGTVEFAPYEETFAAGKAEGIEEGYANGKADGVEEGYANGKTEGIAEGVKAEYDRFWDIYQRNGTRKDYRYAFAGNEAWNDDLFQPKYDIVLGAGQTGSSMFYGCRVKNLTEALEKSGVKLDTTLCTFLGSFFLSALMVRIPEINCTNAPAGGSSTLGHAFAYSTIETIDRLVVVEQLKYDNTFAGCDKLKNIIFDGVIGENISFQWSPLSGESIGSVVSHLSDSAAGKTVTFKLSAVNSAFETAEGAADGSASEAWAALIATKSNWTISCV